MDTGLPIREISVCLHGSDQARDRGAVRASGEVQVPHRAPRAAGEIAEQGPVVEEEQAQAFGQGEDPLVVRDGQEHVLGKMLGP